MRHRPLAHPIFIATLAALLSVPVLTRAGSVSRIVEIRSYNLKPGTRDHFQHVFETDVMGVVV